MMISVKEGVCPFCQATSARVEYSFVMECSGQRYSLCQKCGTKFVDTFLLSHEDEDGNNTYDMSIDYILDDFALEFDSQNPNTPSDYYLELVDSKRYLFETEDGSLYLQSYLLAENIVSADDGVLSIVDMVEKKVYFQGGWKEIECQDDK